MRWPLATELPPNEGLPDVNLSSNARAALRLDTSKQKDVDKDDPGQGK
jgi:hypothetical protein